MIHLREFRKVEIDPDKKRATLGAGWTLSEVHPMLYKHGLAFGATGSILEVSVGVRRSSVVHTRYPQLTLVLVGMLLQQRTWHRIGYLPHGLSCRVLHACDFIWITRPRSQGRRKRRTDRRRRCRLGSMRHSSRGTYHSLPVYAS
jgi:hypothetical protein